MRIMALDVGTKRIGVAVTDALLLTAQGLDSIQCKDAASDREQIIRIIQEYDVGEVVVGWPLNMNGTENKATESVAKFIAMLKERVTIPIMVQDERLTSLQADRTMLEGDLSRKRRRELSDRIAAQLILQSYLDLRRTRSVNG